MKILGKIWLFVSVVALITVAFGIVNTYVSIKYEVDVYGVSGMSTELKEKKRYFNPNTTELAKRCFTSKEVKASLSV